MLPLFASIPVSPRAALISVVLPLTLYKLQYRDHFRCFIDIQSLVWLVLGSGRGVVTLPPGERECCLVAQVVEPATLFLVSYMPHSDLANGIGNCTVLKVIYRPQMESWPGWEQGTPKWHYPPRLVSLSAGTVFLSFPLQC